MLPKWAEGLAIDLFTTKTARVVTLSLIVSAAVFAVVLAIFGFSYGRETGVSLNNPLSAGTRSALSAAFVLLFLSIWFLLYIQTNKEADDLYSGIRNKIKGKWNVTYFATNGPQQTPLFPNTLSIICDIHINPNDKKLELEFDVRGNAIYESARQVINSVALRHDIGNRYDMFYYYNGKRLLKDAVKKYLVSDGDFDPGEGLEV